MKKFSAKQLANQQRFKELVQKKAAAKKGNPQASPSAPAPVTGKSGYGIWIALGVIIVAGVAYWYFTKDKK